MPACTVPGCDYPEGTVCTMLGCPGRFSRAVFPNSGAWKGDGSRDLPAPIPNTDRRAMRDVAVKMKVVK